MAEIVIMPKLGFNMDEGTLTKWHFQEGDFVKEGDVLFEIETDKTNMPVEATVDGTLLKILLEEGNSVPVFEPIAVLGEEGENIDEILQKASSIKEAPEEVEQESPVTVEKSSPTTIKSSELKLTPKAKKLISDDQLDINSIKDIKGTGYQGGITAADIKASPLAVRLAEKEDIDVSTISGTGVAGKIMKSDVERAAVSPVTQLEEKMILSAAEYAGVRKIIGDRLAESKFTAPHLYFTDSIDTSKLTAFRAELNENSDVRISVSDLLVLASSRALSKHPEINVSLIDDQIIQYQSTNIGIAVAGDNGLIVPVVKNAQIKSLTEISAETDDLIARARTGALTMDEYKGGTFTISNLGMFDIENFTAIINPPESAILAVSSVRKKAVVITDSDDNDSIEIRPIMNVQLTVDHRVIDGLAAAEFLSYFKEILENPIKILM